MKQHSTAIYSLTTSAAYALGLLTVVLSGCAMCCGPYDYDYPTFGGRVQRSDPVYGRVGSILSDSHTAGSGPSVDSNILPFDQRHQENRFTDDDTATRLPQSPGFNTTLRGRMPDRFEDFDDGHQLPGEIESAPPARDRVWQVRPSPPSSWR